MTDLVTILAAASIKGWSLPGKKKKEKMDKSKIPHSRCSVADAWLVTGHIRVAEQGGEPVPGKS